MVGSAKFKRAGALKVSHFKKTRGLEVSSIIRPVITGVTWATPFNTCTAS
jgi:hypothetical protein